jgi:ubiquinone/menaquinone biosynthesis C-methylase UbiE
MGPVDPALFYTGIVAQLYGPLRSAGPVDPAPYARFIERCGQPALELGCGDGDPLLQLRQLGLDVEGLDSSPDMIERCRVAATQLGLDVTLHLQRIEDLQIDRQFRTIFLAGPTFNLLPDDDTARHALTRVHAHLATGGSALVPLFIPQPTPPHLLGRPRSHVTDEGSTMTLTMISEQRDETARTQTTMLRYELQTSRSHEVEERPWLLHWYSQDGIRELANDAGFATVRLRSNTGGPATTDALEWTVILSDPVPS